MESKFARSLAGAGGAPPAAAPASAAAELKGSLDVGDLQFGEEIGHGAFSRVYRGALHGEAVAIKKITVPRRDLDRHIQGELELLSSGALNHPNLIRYHGVAIQPGPGSSTVILIVTEFMNGGDLRSVLRRVDVPLPWSLRVRIGRDIAAALAHLHDTAGVVHRDIKTENVLLDERWRCVLADYGFARKMAGPAGSGAATAMTLCGTDEFMVSASERVHLRGRESRDRRDG
jgi:serine/threonine protein kinase